MFTREQAGQLLDEALSARTELAEVECKTGIGNALQHAMCAAANRRDGNGGIVVVGVDEDFNVVGVGDVGVVQKQIADLASQVYNVPLRLGMEPLERNGLTVLALIVPPCPPGHRPCHLLRHGPLKGAWVRVGNTTRLMRADEARREIAADEVARGAVSPFDRTPYLQAGIDVLDDSLIEDYVSRVKKLHPTSRIDSANREQFLRDVSAVAEASGKWYPTPAGLLFFCREPKRYLPQVKVEFLHLWGPEFTSPGPDGSMWRANLEFSGPLPRVIDEVKHALLERIATRGVMDGFQRRDRPEYPEFVLREAIVNAVAHRDYTLRGSRIQIRLYPDRIEFQSPGGLLPPVTVDNIENEHATRNEAIVGLLSELDYMEERGWGYDKIVRELREAGLAPPQIEDTGASFTLTVKSHVLMAPETVEWLKQYASFDLTPHERLSLAYLRVNERLYNRDYVRLTGADRVEATQTLRRLTDLDLLSMKGRRGGAFYVLPARQPTPITGLFKLPASEQEAVLAIARERGRVVRRDVIEKLRCPPRRATALLAELVSRGDLVPRGSKRGRYYEPGVRK
ncbi:MAG: putative DNA binding domain-containing protein [candidate division WOR-3 bacterium]|nr:putative DNA binding domain-containing protein [candidate division WOR-3 bacterium]